MEPDPIETQLSALVRALVDELGNRASIGSEETPDGRFVELIPVGPAALPVNWVDFGSEVVLQAGHNGGRWELDRTPSDVDFLADIVRSVVAGRVVEVFGLGRSRVEVTLRDGSLVTETGSVMGRGCLPLPGWSHRGRRVQYAPYSE